MFYMAMEIVKSVCGLCNGNCGVLITLEDGKPVRVKGKFTQGIG